MTRLFQLLALAGALILGLAWLVLAVYLAGCSAPPPKAEGQRLKTKVKTAVAEARVSALTPVKKSAVPAEIMPPPAPVPACYAMNRYRQVVPTDCRYNSPRHTWVLDIQNPHPLAGTKKPTIQASVNLFTWYTATNILCFLGSTNTNFSVVLSITNKPIEFYRVKWS